MSTKLSVLEQLSICFLWGLGEITEGQASKPLGLDRITARILYDDLYEQSHLLIEKLRANNSNNTKET